ncbi:TPA: hypothetical protein H1005_02830 [archaeon]|uniref:Uncharacterized protein n=1 Tax=Candidatus Naiadarchaeum limnaeum TaxID=2756139 RepID=A0A832UQN6_9ARCH|nr:hypothetical protein [Candidatus Naiadarchaeales archaeon SRR2090153.bin1042]HIJ99956.1 hypothetical protein [Candidatus Naiadarchaeum limnaeum]
MNKKLIPILTLIAIAFIVGCLERGGDGIKEGYPGVIVTDFTPTISTVRAGSPIDFFVTVQNQGFFDAQNVNILIFNCGPSNTGKSSAKTPPDYDYTCNNPVFQNDFNLAKPDRDLGIVGEIKEAEVSLDTDPAGFPEGRSPQTFTARVIYDYKTTGAIDTVFTTFANWKEKSGRITTGPLNMFSEPAPLTLFLNAPREPIVIDNPANQQNFTVGLSIRNTGGGFVKDKLLTKIKLCYNPQFIEPVLDTVTGQHGDFNRTIEGGNCLVVLPGNDNLKLVGLTNQYRDVDARFRNVPNAIKIQDVTTFEAELTYAYTYDRSTSVTILNA